MSTPTLEEYERRRAVQRSRYDQIPPPILVRTSELLPPMFVDVLAFGIVRRINVLPQWYQARRWTGCNYGADPHDTSWEWLTPCDDVVRDVALWVKLPIRAAADSAHALEGK